MGLNRGKELERGAKLNKVMYNRAMIMYDEIIDFDFDPRENVQERFDTLFNKYFA